MPGEHQGHHGAVYPGQKITELVAENVRLTATICPMGTPPLSALLHRHERTVRRWVKGQYPLDAEMAAWLAHLCDWIDAHPAPHGGSRT